MEVISLYQLFYSFYTEISKYNVKCVVLQNRNLCMDRKTKTKDKHKKCNSVDDVSARALTQLAKASIIICLLLYNLRIPQMLNSFLHNWVLL